LWVNGIAGHPQVGVDSAKERNRKRKTETKIRMKEAIIVEVSKKETKG
jgi:hypothetical protein